MWRNMDRLEDHIPAKLSEANLDRVDGLGRNSSRVSCSKAVQVDNVSLTPNEYIRHKPERDNIAIKPALERTGFGDPLGVCLKQTLRIIRK